MNERLNRQIEINIKLFTSKRPTLRSAFFMNNSGLPVLFTSRDNHRFEALVGEAVVFHRESHHNKVDVVRSARPSGKKMAIIDKNSNLNDRDIS